MSNYSDETILEMAELYAEEKGYVQEEGKTLLSVFELYEDYNAFYALEGGNMLDMVELYAEEKNLIEDERELSEQFDENMLPSIIEAYSEDDQPAINEGFNNWTDMLCEDGEIHPIQYDQYCYVGRLSN